MPIAIAVSADLLWGIVFLLERNAKLGSRPYGPFHVLDSLTAPLGAPRASLSLASLPISFYLDTSYEGRGKIYPKRGQVPKGKRGLQGCHKLRQRPAYCPGDLLL